KRVVALESLLRWQHPSYGLIPTERFIGVAEQTGLIVPIGDFVFNRVVQDIRQWRADGCAPVPVSINVSALQLQRSDLATSISERLATLGLKPSMLQIELAQDAVFFRRDAQAESDNDPLQRLRELGVRVAIDDFGTGTSSLTHLKRRR